MSHLAITAWSPISEASSSMTGASLRHGPHQSAQKSTSTGLSDSMTVDLKFSAVT